MKMTLEEARDCLTLTNVCHKCKFRDQPEFDCRGTALEMGASALNYLLIGTRFAKEEEEKER